MDKQLKLYSRSKHNIWTDNHISQKMLSAHLDVTTDAASRNICVIDRTVAWMAQKIPARSAILDLGCGPGLYAERLCKAGYAVTGMDISERSINYAKESAAKQRLDIAYVHQDYIQDTIQGEYDAVVCIYCDFGALIPSEQVILLKKIRAVLNVGGILIFDVFSEGLSATKKEQRVWNYYRDGSFWHPGAHFVLEETVHYPESNAWGSRTIVIAEDVREYITWDAYYTREQITELLKNHGFQVEEVNENLVEKNDFTSNEVMFIQARKI